MEGWGGILWWEDEGVQCFAVGESSSSSSILIVVMSKIMMVLYSGEIAR